MEIVCVTTATILNTHRVALSLCGKSWNSKMLLESPGSSLILRGLIFSGIKIYGINFRGIYGWPFFGN